MQHGCVSVKCMVPAGTGTCIADHLELTLVSNRLDYSRLGSGVYDSDPYDDIPQYEWNASFDTAAFAHSIDADNNILFEKLKVVICQKLHIHYQGFGCKLIFPASFMVPSIILTEPS